MNHLDVKTVMRYINETDGNAFSALVLAYTTNVMSINGWTQLIVSPLHPVGVLTVLVKLPIDPADRFNPSAGLRQSV